MEMGHALRGRKTGEPRLPSRSSSLNLPPKPRPSTSSSAGTTWSRPRWATSATCPRASWRGRGEGLRSSLHPPRDKKKTIDDLKKAAEKADNVYLAADPDREGEAICCTSRRSSRAASGSSTACSSTRSRKGGHPGLRAPPQGGRHKVDAQQARRILDRLVGLQDQPASVGQGAAGLSAGRVQSVALRIIVDREREINAFKRRSSGRSRRCSPPPRRRPARASPSKRSWSDGSEPAAAVEDRGQGRDAGPRDLAASSRGEGDRQPPRRGRRRPVGPGAGVTWRVSSVAAKEKKKSPPPPSPPASCSRMPRGATAPRRQDERVAQGCTKGRTWRTAAASV